MSGMERVLVVPVLGDNCNVSILRVRRGKGRGKGCGKGRGKGRGKQPETLAALGRYPSFRDRTCQSPSFLSRPPGSQGCMSHTYARPSAFLLGLCHS